MSEISRRNFLLKTVTGGAGVIFSTHLSNGISFFSENTDISVVSGNDFFENTIKAVEQLGGIEKFAKQGSKVGLLVNFTGQWTRVGTYVNPEIVLAVLKMLNDRCERYYLSCSSHEKLL